MSRFLSNKELNALIKAELLARVTPQLFELGFKPFGRIRKGKLPFRYWRECNGRIDMLEFQWDKYNRPRFIINFRPVEDEHDIARLKGDPRQWHHIYGSYFRASDRRHRWFMLSLFARLFYPNPAIPRLVGKVLQRVTEIDAFLNGGEPSAHLSSVATPYSLDAWPDEFFRPPRRTIER